MNKYTSVEILAKILGLAQRMSRPTKAPDEYVLKEQYLSFIQKFMETIDPSFHVPSVNPMVMILKYVSLLEQKYAARQTPIRIIHFLHTFSGYDLEDGYTYDSDIRNKNITHAESVLDGFRKTNPEVSKIVDDLMNCVYKMNTMEDEVLTLKEECCSCVESLRAIEEELRTAEKNLKSYSRKGASKKVLYSFNKAFNEPLHEFYHLRRKFMKKQTKSVMAMLEGEVAFYKEKFTNALKSFNISTNKHINRLETIPGLLSKEMKNFEESKKKLLNYVGLYSEEDIIV